MPDRSRPVSSSVVTLLVLLAVLICMVWWLTPWSSLPESGDVHASVNKYFTPPQISRSEAFHDDAKWPAWLGLATNLGVAVTWVSPLPAEA
jgi:hypothetical protein